VKSIGKIHWYDPDRFEAPQDIIDHSFVPFGEGLRGCPGKPLAYFEMKIILCMLYKYYEFEYLAKP
jgi:cytochrome P450